MKRWFAGILAVILLFSGGSAFAESNPAQGNASLPETASEDGKGIGTLADNFRFLAETFRNEEVRGLLQRQDIQDLFNEVILRVLIWMIENRPVTMEILAELGVSKTDRGYIDRIWDSADRIAAAAEEYKETEDGKLLQQEIELVQNDPDINEALDSLFRFFNSGEFVQLLQEIQEAADTDAEEAEGTAVPGDSPETGTTGTEEETAGASEPQEGLMMQQARERQMDSTTFSGKVLLAVIRLLDNTDLEIDFLAKLLTNENLWTLIIHLANRESDVALQVREEYEHLMSDPEMVMFLKTTADELFAARDQIFDLMGGVSEEELPESGDQKEEVVP